MDIVSKISKKFSVSKPTVKQWLDGTRTPTYSMMPAIIRGFVELVEEILAYEIETFICPECGSEYWGTYGATGPLEEMEGHCHGNGCDFTWKRDEDHKVMWLVSRRRVPK